MDNLKKICNEIFGSWQVEDFVWDKEAEGKSGTLKRVTRFRNVHEYILVCYKNINKIEFNKVNEALRNKENKLQTANLAVNTTNEKLSHPNYFTITNPSGDKFTKQWKWDKNKIDMLISENLIFWGSDGHKQPRLIIPTDNRRTTFLESILKYGGTTTGRKDFELIMPKEIFSYPKPVILIKKLLETSTLKDALVLDFFSGSATTAHAVMQLNAEDGGHRKFIMVQLPEQTDEKSEAYKAGYQNICEIGKERIRRAGNKIAQDNPQAKFDKGFRVLKCDSSNMQESYYHPAEYSPDMLDSLVDNIKPNRTTEDLLFQVMLDLGVLLSSKIKQTTIAGKKVFNVAENFLITCFDSDITDDTITAIAKQKPYYFVMRDSSMANDNVATNFEQIFNTYSPETKKKVL